MSDVGAPPSTASRRYVVPVVLIVPTFDSAIALEPITRELIGTENAVAIGVAPT